MMPRLHHFLAALLLLSATGAVAGETLSIRLIQSVKKGEGDAKGIEDVVDVLRKGLNFKDQKLVERKTTELPADDVNITIGNYKVNCNGDKDSLELIVITGKKELMKATVKLKKGKPLILGAFPAKEGKQIIVFKTEE